MYKNEDCNALRKWRKNAGLTLDDAAKVLECSPGYISLLERKKNLPSVKLLLRIRKKTNDMVGLDDFVK